MIVGMMCSPGEFDELERAFLERVYALAATDLRRAAMEVVDRLDDYQHAGMFAECDRLLACVDAERLKDYPSLMVSFLGITVAAAPRLPSRPDLYDSVHCVLSRELGVMRADDILIRFKV